MANMVFQPRIVPPAPTKQCIMGGVAARQKRGTRQRKRHTKISSAVSDFGSDWVDMVPGDRTGAGGASRNGFRETGRGGGSSKGEAGDASAGEAARLRKGLLEERFRERPAAVSGPEFVLCFSKTILRSIPGGLAKTKRQRRGGEE